MAHLFKHCYTQRDRRTGQPVRRKTRKWYGQFRDADGVVRRVPLCADKAAAQAMLNALVLRSERRKAGLSDPLEDHLVRPLTDHVQEFRSFLLAKEGTVKQVEQTVSRLKKLIAGCGFSKLSDLNAGVVIDWLAQQRRTQRRFSVRTSNFYQKAAKQFCLWLEENDRILKSPLARLRCLNTETDLRHQRRTLSVAEFHKLIESTAHGPVIEGISGPDRAMLYLLAAWTGCRRRELASLTLKSFDFNSTLPTVAIMACYSKRRRQDVLPLHPALVERLQTWLAGKGELHPEQPLFALRTANGEFRRTSKMMQRDLRSAEIAYRNEQGLFADFHAHRHTFISNLSRVGVKPKLAQSLARHSDINLTMQVYTHLELEEQSVALNALAPPPVVRATVPDNTVADKPTENLLALRLALPDDISRPAMATPDNRQRGGGRRRSRRNPLNDRTLGNVCRQESLIVEAHRAGLEPATFGSVVPP